MEENKKQHSGFGTAFLLGLVIGASLALLFATKRGRRILKALSEGGLDKLDNLQEMKGYIRTTVDEYVSDDEEASAREYVDEKVRMAEMPKEHVTHHEEKEDADNGTAKKPHPVKRLFRGVPKKS